MKHRLFTLFVSIGLLFLAGCATNPGSQPAIPAALDAGDGVVMVKVIGVQPLSAFNAKWRSMTLVEEGTGRSQLLNDSAAANAGYSLFVATVPQGRYRVSSFDSAGPAPANFGILPALIIMAMTSDNASIQSQMGSFSVKPGALSNLGVIVSALPADKKEQLQIAVLADAHAQASTLSDVDAATRDRVRSMAVRAWDQAHDPVSTSRALEIVRTRASNVSSIAVTDDQRLMIGSALGMVHVLDAQGQWSVMSTGGLDNVTYLRALPEGRVFAGTDSGRYFLWLPDQRTWRAHQLAGGDRIMHLEPMGGAGFALLTQEPMKAGAIVSLKQRLLFKADLADAVEAKEMIALPGFSATGKLPVYFNGKELLAHFNHVGISRTADLHRIEPKTLAVKTEKLDHWVQDIYPASAGMLVRERMNGMSIYSDFSGDDGGSWARNEASGPYVTRFLDRAVGYGLSVVSTGWSTVTVALNKTTTGGKEWVRMGVPIESSGPSQIRLVGSRVFVFTGRQLLSTADDGKTWKVDWPLQAGAAH